MQYDFDWSYIWDSRIPLARGLEITLLVAILGISLAIAIGLLGAGVRIFRVRGANALVQGYVALIRNTPILVQLFFIFYGLPAIGLRLSPFWSGVVMLAVWGGAYNVENMRGALAAIDIGQRDAAFALGLRPLQYFRLVAVPIAVRHALPAVMNTAISMLKNSSYLQTIGLAELTFVAVDRISLSFRTLEMFSAIGAIYLSLGLSLTYGVGILERRLQRPFRV